METSIIDGTNTIVCNTQKDENLHGLLNGMKSFARKDFVFRKRSKTKRYRNKLFYKVVERR